MPNPSQFEHDLMHLINKHSMESGSDTPDFILAEYLVACLNAFSTATCARSKWYSNPEHEFEQARPALEPLHIICGCPDCKFVDYVRVGHCSTCNDTGVGIQVTKKS